MKNKKNLIISKQLFFSNFVFILFILLAIFYFSEEISNSDYDILKLKSSSIVRPPIYIDGNVVLDTFCSGNGTDGTYSNPHVIENYEIDAGGVGSGIEIKNTNKYLIIRNCTIRYSGDPVWVSNASIQLINSTYVEIINNNLKNSNSIGISLENSKNNSLSHNDASNSGVFGIYLNHSDKNVIFSNNISNIPYGTGIYLSHSNYNIISTNFISKGSNGISLDYSNSNILSGNVASYNNVWGIILVESEDNTVNNNTIIFTSAINAGITAGCVRDYHGENNEIYDNYCNDTDITRYIKFGITMIIILVICLPIAIFFFIKLKKKKDVVKKI